MKKTVLALLTVASMNAYAVQTPEATARSFMAQIAHVDPAQVRVVVDRASSLSATATATAPDGESCSFAMIPPPAGTGYAAWLVGAMDCKKRGGGGIPITDYAAIKQAEEAAKKWAADEAKVKAAAAAAAAAKKAEAGQ